MVEIFNVSVEIEGFACGSVGNGGWETSMMVFFAHEIGQIRKQQ